ncbi:MAG: hypothetical protein CM15mP62_26020 [Rhodospirillaceae bacterium]|nr:MAG: hypothetical protein CM15mP62_26020 [Rhodospirillaceae bacterium]
MSKGNVEITNAKDSEHFDVLIVSAAFPAWQLEFTLINTALAKIFDTEAGEKAMVERGGHIVPQGFVQIVTFTPWI